MDLLQEQFLDRKKIRERIEDGLGGRGKLRILGVLGENLSELCSKYMLGRKTGLRSHALKPDLEALLKIGWVRRYDYAPVKYGLNLDNSEVRLVVEFLRKTGYV